MAGDWIKMRIGIEADPAVFAIASRLKLDRFAVVGRLSAFWGWMNQHSEDGAVTLAGNVTGNAPDNVATDSCGIIDTITGVAGFAEALHAVGWLIFTRVGFEIPSYDKYNRSSAKTRSANAIRQARYKEKQRAAKAASPPPQTDGNALPNVTSNASVTPPVTLPVTDENASREEKRREEKSIKKSPLPPTGDEGSKPPTAKENTEAASGVPIPSTLDTPEFREAWATWIQDRYDRRKAMTATAEKAQLDRLAKVGVAKAIDTISNSIANGWAGLFPEPDKPTLRPKTPETLEEKMKRMANEMNNRPQGGS